MAKNRFADAADKEELIHQVVGAGSMCWENLSAAGRFKPDEAGRTARDALARLAELSE